MCLIAFVFLFPLFAFLEIIIYNSSFFPYSHCEFTCYNVVPVAFCLFKANFFKLPIPTTMMCFVFKDMNYAFNIKHLIPRNMMFTILRAHVNIIWYLFYLYG